jgi:ribonuclease HI
MEEQLELFNALKKASSPAKTASPSIKPLPEKKNPAPAPKITLLVFVDGAARGNPGPSGAGVYIATQNRIPLVRKGYYLKHKTNNQAEYLALILACIHVQTLIKNEPTAHVIFHSDSQLLVRQIQGIYKVKNEILITLHHVAKELLGHIPYSIMHVERELNTNADTLANLGVDKKGKIPQAVASTLEAHGITIE